MAATILLVQIAWGNLTALGIGRYQLLYDDVALPRLAVAAVGISMAWLVLAAGAVRGERRLAVDPVWALLAALTLWAVVSALLSDQGPSVWLGQSERLEGVVTVALYAAAYGAGLQVGSGDSRLLRLCAALIAGAAVLAAHGILQMAWLDPSDRSFISYAFDTRYARASLGNPNFLGSALVLALPVALAAAISVTRRESRIAAASAAVLVAIALVGTRSQAAWLCGTGALVAGAWLYMKRPGGRTRRALAFAAGVGLVAVLVLGSVSIFAKGYGLDALSRSSGRAELLSIAAATTAGHPLTGVGPDAFLAAFRENRSEDYVRVHGADSTNNNAHAWVMQYAATLGMPGALLLAGALGIGLWRGRPSSDSSRATLIRLGMWAGLLGLAVNLQMSVAVLAVTVPFWVLLGAVASVRAGAVELPSAGAVSIAVVCTVLALAAASGSARLIAADAIYLRSRLAYNGMGDGDSVALADEAARLNPAAVKYARGAAEARMALALAEIGRHGATPQSAQPLFEDASMTLEQVTARWPGDYPAHAWLAGLQAAMGKRFGDERMLEQARVTVQQAARLDPVHADLRLLARGDTSRAAIDAALATPGLP